MCRVNFAKGSLGSTPLFHRMELKQQLTLGEGGGEFGQSFSPDLVCI